MSLFEWDDEYSVGDPVLDSQHQGIFSTINKLYDAMEANRGADVLGQVLDEMLGYVSYHFAAEEVLMRRSNFPGIEPHIAAHRELAERVQLFKKRFDAGEMAVETEMLPVLIGDWLMDHIAVMDKQYEPYVASLPASERTF